MTLKDLSQLYYLNREIDQLVKRLRTLESETSPASPSLSGMPRSKGYNNSRVEDDALNVIELRNILDKRRKRLEFEKLRLENYISTIPDSLTRQIFVYRFVNGLPWEQVAACIGGNNTADSVKKCCYRYLNKQKVKQ